MNALGNLLQKLENWVRNYPRLAVLGFAVFLVAFGWLAALVLIRSGEENWNILVDVLTFFGTVGAAGAAFLAANAAAKSANLTKETLNHQINLDERAKQPSLIISDAVWDNSQSLNGFRVEFANLGQSPVFVRTFVNDVYIRNNNINEPFELFVPAADKKDRVVQVVFPIEGLVVGELRFFFQYGATGLIYHRIAIPYKIETRFDNFPNGLLTQTQTILSAEQKITENLGFERDLLQQNLLDERCFQNFDWSVYP